MIHSSDARGGGGRGRGPARARHRARLCVQGLRTEGRRQHGAAALTGGVVCDCCRGIVVRTVAKVFCGTYATAAAKAGYRVKAANVGRPRYLATTSCDCIEGQAQRVWESFDYLRVACFQTCNYYPAASPICRIDCAHVGRQKSVQTDRGGTALA